MALLMSLLGLSDLTYTGTTSISSAKKQSQRDVAMNENMKLIGLIEELEAGYLIT